VADLSKLSINTLTNKPLPFEELVNLYARKGVPAFSPWHTEIDSVGLSVAKKMIADSGLSVTSMCLCGLFSNEGRENRSDVLAHNRRVLDIAAEVGAPYVTIVPGGILPGTKSIQDTLDYNFDCVAETLEHANSVGVGLALEPLHPIYLADWSGVNTLKTANDWCEKLGDGIGVAVDIYHVWWDPNLPEEITRASQAGTLLAYCVGDFLDPTSHPLNDRGLMGDGVIDIPSITKLVEDAGYDGPYEVELFTSTWWVEDQGVFIDEIKDRFVRFV